MLIRTYRVRGHLAAKLDPLGLTKRDLPADLTPEYHGFSGAALDRKVYLGGSLGLEYATVRELVAILQANYCGPVGLEYMHIADVEERRFLQDRLEGKDKEIHFTPEGKKAILSKVIHAEQYEKFLGKKYVGTKRFGLDGGESMIPALEAVIKYGGQQGVREIVYGMAHRGRLNVLTNVMAKPHRAVFHEFKGGSSAPDDVEGSGDVKNHLSASSDREFDGLFTTDKPVIFAFHGYPWLVHRLVYRRTNHANFHVHGYREEGTTTTPFDMCVLNDLDRYHLVIDVIDRVPSLGSRYAGLRQKMQDKRIEAREYTREHGDDIPEVRDWLWPGARDVAGDTAVAATLATGGDNE